MTTLYVKDSGGFGKPAMRRSCIARKASLESDFVWDRQYSQAPRVPANFCGYA